MKKAAITLALMIVASAGWAQYYPTVATKGAVAGGDLAIFDGVSGRYIRSGSIIDGLRVGIKSQVGTNLCSLTGVYTGVVSVTGIVFEGTAPVSRGGIYMAGFSKSVADGSVTMSVAGLTLSGTAAGSISNYFVAGGTATTNVSLGIYGSGVIASNVYVKAITNGNVYVAGDVYGKRVFVDSIEITPISITGTPVYVESDPVAGTNLSAHVGDTNNPHTVTAGQIGAATGTPVYVESDPIASTNLSAHVGDTNNPHAITAGQIGAATGTPVYVESDPVASSNLTVHTSDTNNPHAITAGQIGAATGTPVYVESDPVWGSEKSLYYLASNPNNYLSATTNIFTSLYAADRSQLGTNIAGLTQGTYTGSLTSVSYTGATIMVVGRTYAWGYTKIGANGTSTLSIASQSLAATTAGNTSNHFTYAGTDTNLILKLDGNGLSICNVSNVYVRRITNGNISAAGDINAGGAIRAGDFVMAYSGEQSINEGSSIVPYSNVRLNNTNGVIVNLGNPQVETNGVSDGTIMYLRGAAGTGGIQFVNGNGVAADCELGFLVKSNDVLQFVFFGGQWTEMKRIDK